MSLIQFERVQVGEVGLLPGTIKMVSTDSLATITTAGYINPRVTDVQLSASDVIWCLYSYNQSTGAGTYAQFQPTFSSGIITLVISVSPGNVLLPVVSGNIPVFNGTTGQIKDSAMSPTDPTKTKLVSLNAAPTSGHIAAFTSANGTIGDGGVLGQAAAKAVSDNASGTVASVGSAVQVNYIAKFIDVSGTIDDTAGTAINAGSIQAGLSGTAGNLIAYPAGALAGRFIISAIGNVGDFSVTLENAIHGQATTYAIPDVGAANGSILNTAAGFISGNFPVASGTGGVMVDSGRAADVLLYSAIVTPDVSINLVRFDVTVGQADLAAGASKILYASGGTKQYRIVALWINSGGTNFSGGGGDRLGEITDGTTSYSIIPAATMQALVNAAWGGGTDLPFPASAPLNTATVAGANLVMKYNTGTTDYLAGSVVISGILQRIA